MDETEQDRIVLQFGLQHVGVMVLRVREPNRPRPFRVWLYPAPPVLALLAERHPASAAVAGLRLPGSFDGFETAVRIVLGQQISVAAARTITRRLVERFGVPVETPWPGVHCTQADSARHYGRHWHDGHGLGLIDGGGQRSASGRGPVQALAGDLIATNPGEVHDGRPLDERPIDVRQVDNASVRAQQLEKLKRLRADVHLRDTPVIVLSASAMPEEIALARSHGATDDWTKPLDFQRFLAGIAQALAGVTVA